MDGEFAPGFHLFLGDNAQGKTNLLEAIYLMASLRSFRGVAGSQMVRHGQKGYFVSGQVSSTAWHEIKLYWSASERRITLNNQPIRRLSDFLGTLRAVVFCTEDLQLIKGSAGSRRRYLDFLLVQTHPQYLSLLQSYTRALRSRNALLKQHRPDVTALDGFTHELVRYGCEIQKMRSELTPRISPIVCQAYQGISRGAESLKVIYLPDVKGDFLVELTRSRGREQVCRFTVVGPHKDDVDLLLDGKSASKFASEGQKRSIAIAMKMAQAEYLDQIHGSPPILLIDDVMGELDVHRRGGLLPLLSRTHRSHGQVFMTCTEENWPQELGTGLYRWNVEKGILTSPK